MANSQQRAVSSPWSISTDGLPFLLLVSMAFFVVADAGAISSLDGFLFIFPLAVFVPGLRPCLLMLISSIQDARGFAYQWSYVSFVAVSTLMIADYMRKAGCKRFRRLSTTSGNRDFRLIAILGTLVVVYAFAVSLANALLHGYAQSSERPFPIIAFLMVLMIAASYVTIILIRSQKNGLRNISVVIALCVGHIMLITLLQIAVKPELVRSSEMVGKVMEEGQLVTASAFGLPRLNGTYLNSNSFALGTALLLSTLVGCLGNGSSRLVFVVVYSVVGFYVSFLSLTKSVTAYFVTTATILLLRLRSAYKKVIIALVILVGILILRFVIIENWDLVVLAFRYKGDDIGTRGLAWGSILQEFNIADWVVGTGLAHWPIFFHEKIGLELSDPHTVLLSIPGTYGFMGIMFYVVLALSFVRILISKSSAQHAKLLILMLMAMLFGKDLVSIPCVFGNTPLTYLMWVSIGLGFVSKRKEGRVEKTGIREESERGKACLGKGR